MATGLLRKLAFRVIDRYMATEVVRVFNECLSDERLSRRKLVERQNELLRGLLIQAAEQSPYYARIFAEYGVNPPQADIQRFAELPVLTKRLIREHFNEILARNFREYAPRITRTSGSTGEPLSIYHTGRSHTYLRALNFAGWAQRGYQLGEPYAAFAGGSLLPDTIGFKQSVYAWLQNCRVMPSYHLSGGRFNRYLDALLRRKIPYIYGYASALYDFARAVENKNIDFGFVRGVFTTADMLYPAQRRIIEKVLGVSIIDIYGNPESGLMSYECDRHDGFHYGMQNALVEIADDEGRPLPEGEVGRILVTSLNNYSFPLLRYDTGDEGALSFAECSCGRGYVKIVRLGGRSRDYIVLPDGRHIHGAFFNHLQSIYTAPWLDRYHIRQPSPAELVLECLCNRPPTSAELETVAAEIRTGTHNLLSVKVQPVEALPMTRRGKYKLISREFEEGSGS